jgi:hypothetical protein
MTRQDFTINITGLLYDMIKAGERPVIDFALRSWQEQKRLFDDKKSQCDGIEKLSNHQRGLAVDIYLTNDKGEIQFDWDEAKAIYWHDKWIKEYEGRAIIIFRDGTKDYPHFEPSNINI